MPAKGFLSLEQQKKLQKTLKKHEHTEIRERILILFKSIEQLELVLSFWLVFFRVH